MNSRIDEYQYDDAIVRKFMWATLAWGIIGMLVGLWLALQLAWHSANVGTWFTFGRLRPLHTNAILFAFVGNGIFTGVYYSTQRLLKTSLFSRKLSQVHFWGWQLMVVAAGVTLPLGITQGKELAELEWPIDLALALVWIVFAVNLFGTIARRRERLMYVSIWFYIATVVAVAVLHVLNSLVVPSAALESHSMFRGTQDAIVQSWYSQNLMAFFLTMPILGLMYYFLPKAARQPVFSYKLAIFHFWALLLIYMAAGPQNLHYTAIPAWVSTLGMLFALLLWMPSWGGMVNGLLTLRGAWHKVTEDPTLKFFVVAVSFYGLVTLEASILSVKSVSALAHYTDWSIAHVHAGALGWVGFMLFGMMYWLAPRLFQAELYSKKLAERHFWIGTVGILLSIVPIYVAGITQGLMLSSLDGDGALRYEFVETVASTQALYWARFGGGLLYCTGAMLCVYNLARTWAARPEAYHVPVVRAPALEQEYLPPPSRETSLEQSGGHVLSSAVKLESLLSGDWHRRWEARPLRFTIAVCMVVVLASAFALMPLLVTEQSLAETSDDVAIAPTVQPYTPLELLGRDLYLSNGCNNCHSQMIRPLYAETRRYGEPSKAIEFVYDAPALWGSRRVGPDLHRIGGRKNHFWHFQHFREPQRLVPDSIMPSYPSLFESEVNFDAAQSGIDAQIMFGAAYDEYLPRAISDAESVAREQASKMARELADQAQPKEKWSQAQHEEFVAEFETKQVVALIAYLQRLGTDVSGHSDPVKTEEGGPVSPDKGRPKMGSFAPTRAGKGSD